MVTKLTFKSSKVKLVVVRMGEVALGKVPDRRDLSRPPASRMLEREKSFGIIMTFEKDNMTLTISSKK